MIDMSSEMWEHHPDGEMYFDKCLDFLTELYQHFREVHAKHTIVISLFSRVQPNFRPTSATPTFRCLSPSNLSKPKDTDFIHTISFADSFPLTLLNSRLKQYFSQWKKMTSIENEAILCSSKNSNLLESIITVLHHFGSHFRGGGSETMLIITPGPGLIKCNSLVKSLCKRIVLKNYANIQMVSLATKPLYTTPLILLNDVEAEERNYYIPCWIKIRYYQSFTFDAFKLCRSHNCHNCLTKNFDKNAEYFFVPLIKRKCIVKQDYLVPIDQETSTDICQIKQSLLPLNGVSPLHINVIPKEHSLAYCISESLNHPRNDPWDNLIKLQFPSKYISETPTKLFKKIEEINYVVVPSNNVIPKQLFNIMIGNRVSLGFQFNPNTTSENSVTLYSPDAIHLLQLKENGVEVKIQQKVYSSISLLPYHYSFIAITTPPISPEFDITKYNKTTRTINLQPLRGMNWKVYDNFDSFTVDDVSLDKFHSQIFHVSSKESEEEQLFAFFKYYEFIISQSDNMVEWFPIIFNKIDVKRNEIDYFNIDKVLQTMIKDIHGKVSGTTLATWMCNKTNVVNRMHAKIILNALLKRQLIIGPEGQNSFVDSQQVIYTTLPLQRTNPADVVERQVQATPSPFHYRSFLVRINCGEDKKENYFLEMAKVFTPNEHYHIGFYWLNVFMSPRTMDSIIASHCKHFEKNVDLSFVQQILPRDIAVMKSLDCKTQKTSKKHQNPINCKFQ
ncbi:hypothetical protein ENUP19_0317G0090 [Entamoeba nuttalli]|uniref:Vacuolar membrane-associated protein Iml1 N-terminal domain-containing protein n=2 Tax=Entamoeba nuttalli TaxID=412467 RepID=K2HDG2_ENTNP|nr:hypothetical protein ENU1_078060 [Entamoeba nuttalli P19]EKE40834.1 hypothetical protein ENU1_078060 [Entamoeba nuttalli P19]|eukprot:XP_008856826.1 hypothetical protein ENU1_078060 [Entamoeba nuttalli P19]